VVDKLAKLVITKNDNVRKYLAAAIARCAPVPDNRQKFGQQGAIPLVVEFLKSDDAEVHQSTAAALHRLTEDSMFETRKLLIAV